MPDEQRAQVGAARAAPLLTADGGWAHAAARPASDTNPMAAMELKTAEVPNPHFARIGGAPVVRLLVESFIAGWTRCPRRPVSVRCTPRISTEIKFVLQLYLVEWLGGPKDYSAASRSPRLRARHSMFPIGVAERDAWMLCMRGALDEVVADAELRNQLENAFLRTANAIVNTRP